MIDRETLQRVAALGPPATRREAAEQLAAHLGAAAVYVFVPHPDVAGRFVPAPGFASTLPAGRGWRDLLTRATSRGAHAGSVAYPTADTDAPAIAYASEGLVCVLVGHAEPAVAFATILDVVAPLLAALLAAEQETVAARGALAVAHEASQRASALAEALDIARNQAERATRVKDEFLAMLGHELRNPLAPMVIGLQMLRTSGAQQRVQDVLERQVAHMSRLVDDLLDVARITRGKIDLRKDVLEIHSVVTRGIEMAQPILEQKRSDLTLDVATTGLTVYGDPARLSQVIANLVSNAAKYSDPSAKIAITAERSDQLVVIRVSDTGIGIASDYIDRVFDQFVQVPQGADRASGGLGLGLAIVRSLVSLHGGRVSALSDGPGRGSTFVVELPFAPGRVTTQPAKLVQAAPARDIAVLIVDDNRDAAELLGDILGTVGYDPRIAHSAPEALELLETFTPALAVLDIGLPVIDGYELARRIRKRLPHTRLVAVTGYGQASDHERTREAGFDAHLVKPVSVEKLTATLDHLLTM